MDRHKIQINRHIKKEEFKSGSAKRKIAKEKEKKNEEVIAKSRRMTDYMKFKPSSSAASQNIDDDTRSPASPSQPQNFEDGEVVSSIKIIIKVVEIVKITKIYYQYFDFHSGVVLCSNNFDLSKLFSTDFVCDGLLMFCLCSNILIFKGLLVSQTKSVITEHRENNNHTVHNV